MIVCKQCGHQNEDNDTFCGSCGKFLEWTGERVVVAEPEPEPPPPAPAAEPEPVRLGLIDRVKHAVFVEEPVPQPAEPVASAAPPPPPPPPPAPTPSYRTVPLTSSAPPPAPPAPAAPAYAPTASLGAPAATPAASSGPVLARVGAPAAAAPAPPATPLADEPMSRRPTSVAPTVARPRQAPRMEPPTRRHPGDLICGQCGEGNDPVRHFCRRCGSSLDEAAVVSLPWYRRFFNRLFGVRTREAGWRPKRVGAPNVLGFVMRIVRLAIAAILVVAVLAFLLVPPFHNLVVDRVTNAITSIRKIVHPNYDPIHPIGASATTSIAGHLPPLAMDGFSNTYWAALPSDRAPVLVLKFAGPVDIADIGFISGASGTAPADQFLAQPRPRAVHLVFSNGTTQDVNLSDSEKAQFYALNGAKQVTFVEIHIMTVWATAGAAPSSVAITEVEFRVKD